MPSPPLLRTIQTEPPETGVLRPKKQWVYDPTLRAAWWTDPKRVSLPRPQRDLCKRVYVDRAGRAFFSKAELGNWVEMNERLGNIRAGKRAYTPKPDLSKEQLHKEWRAGMPLPTPLPTTIVVLGSARRPFAKGVKKLDEAAFVKRIAIMNAKRSEQSGG